MPRCIKCNRKVTKTYDNVCTMCISANVQSDGVEVQAYDPDDDIFVHKEFSMPNEPGYFGNVVKAQQEVENKLLKNTQNSDKEEDKMPKAFYRIVRKSFNEKDYKLYKFALRTLFNKYSPQLTTGEYKICKKGDYGISNEFGGTVVESYSGIIIYKEVVYLDTDNIRIDPYAEDTELIPDYSEDYAENTEIL